jgi:hypothetical protein
MAQEEGAPAPEEGGTQDAAGNNNAAIYTVDTVFKG